jgi:predicted Ser/Thr protein kinase
MNETTAYPSHLMVENAHDSLGTADTLGAGPPELDRELLRSTVARSLFPDLATSPKIGRFTVLERLGAGGMGVVYAAYDPHLDRRIAVKVLHSSPKKSTRSRLLREARALAKLSHPNVVSIFETGTVGAQVYVAMEFIDGPTLGEWMREAERPYKEVIEKFAQAGAGLSAAHRAGIVHRDFKPDNAMIGGDGRVRVLDFGLARTIADAPPTLDEREPGDEAELGLAQVHTKTGALMGTPAYMAPEQIRGRGADVRSDVFSFCVSLYEALFGTRPFTGQSLKDLLAAIESGDLLRVDTPGVPSRLRDVLEQGLRADPQARPASIEEVVSNLQRAARGRRWKSPVVLATGVAAGTALALVGAFGLSVFAVWHAPVEEDACEPPERWMAGVWDADRHHQLVANLGGKTEDATKLTDALDTIAENWQRDYAEVCEEIRTTSSGWTEFSARDCLLAKRELITATVDVLSDPHDESSLESKLDLVQWTAQTAVCDDSGGPTLHGYPLERLRAIQTARLALMPWLGRGRYEDLDPAEVGEIPAVATADDPQLEAEVAYARAIDLLVRGEYRAADTALKTVAAEAKASNHSYLGLRAMLSAQDVFPRIQWLRRLDAVAWGERFGQLGKWMNRGDYDHALRWEFEKAGYFDVVAAAEGLQWQHYRAGDPLRLVLLLEYSMRAGPRDDSARAEREAFLAEADAATAKFLETTADPRAQIEFLQLRGMTAARFGGDRAAQILLKALAIARDHGSSRVRAALHDGLAMAYGRHDPDRAIVHANEAQVLREASAGATVHGWVELAALHARLDQREQALESMRRASLLAADDPRLWGADEALAMAIALLATGDAREALETAYQVYDHIDTRSEDPEIAFTSELAAGIMSSAQIAIGDLELAAQRLEMVRRTHGNDNKRTKFLLALALERLGRESDTLGISSKAAREELVEANMPPFELLLRATILRL